MVAWSKGLKKGPETGFYLPPDMCADRYTGLRRTYLTYEDEAKMDDIDIFLNRSQVIVCVGALTVHVDDILAAGCAHRGAAAGARVYVHLHERHDG